MSAFGRLCCKSRPVSRRPSATGNNRIRKRGFVNQYSPFGFVLERLFLAPGPKIFLQQYRPKADIAAVLSDVRFSNRPFGVKRFWLSTTEVSNLGLDVAPCRSLAMAVRQMLHQRPHVGERCKLHDLGNNESDAASVAPNPHAYATPTAFYERKTSNSTYKSAYASRMKLISLMHGPAGGECLPLKSRGKSLTLNLLTVC